MRRGDIVIVAQKGVYEGKPRPAVVIQSNDFVELHSSVLVCLIADAAEAEGGEAFYRIPIAPTDSNGLKLASTIMADKIVTIKRQKIGKIVGRLDEATLGKLNSALAVFQGLA